MKTSNDLVSATKMHQSVFITYRDYLGNAAVIKLDINSPEFEACRKKRKRENDPGKYHCYFVRRNNTDYLSNNKLRTGM